MTEDVVYSEVVFVKKNKVDKEDPDQPDLDQVSQKTVCCDRARLVLAALCVVISGGLIALSFQCMYAADPTHLLQIHILRFITDVYTEKQLRGLQELRNALNENLTAMSAVLQDMQNQQQNLSCALKDCACPKGWEYHAGKCYFFSSNSLNWAKSRDACISDGGHLVIINNKEEQEFLLSKIKESFWIGMTDQKIENKWLWVDNTALEGESYWINDEPDNWKGNGGQHSEGEDCARIEKTYLIKSWFDAFCTNLNRRICETKSSKQI